MAKKVLVVTKDRMEFNLYHPVAEILRAQGVEVVIVAEGLSMEMWQKAGYDIFGGLPAEGKFDPNTLVRNDLNPAQILADLNPGVVMTGLGSPIHLAESFGLEANKFGFSLGFVEDVWGVHARSKAVPDFVCTLDDYGKRMVRYYYDFPPVIIIAGSPAMGTLKEAKPDPETEAAVQKYGCRRVILVGGGDDSTTPMMRGLLEMLKLADYPCLIIPRFHPKYMKDAAYESFAVEWMRILFQIPPLHKVWWTGPSVNTQSLILSATEVVTIFSNLLTEAVVLGRLAISWNSELGRQRMKASLGVEEFPLCQFGAVTQVEDPAQYLSGVPLRGTDDYKRFVAQAQQVVRSDGKNAERVAEAILTAIA